MLNSWLFFVSFHYCHIVSGIFRECKRLIFRLLSVFHVEHFGNFYTDFGNSGENIWRYGKEFVSLHMDNNGRNN